MEENEKLFWADQIAAKASGPQVVNDAKTPSGKVHVGALRGVIIHDTIYKAIKDAGKKAEYLYGFDDFDPMDGMPAYMPEKFREYMGLPLNKVPSPEKGFESFAEFYAKDFQEVYEKIGCEPKTYWTSELYKSGKFNATIKTALENAEKIRQIYKQVSGGEKKEDWMPFQVVCDECGKIGTTKVHSFDGKNVFYTCEPSMVKWAKGCGHKGEKNPFDGGGKFPYKVEWAAKWVVLGVTIEGAGKDHSSKGGSRDISNRIAREVFGINDPYNVPYEHFLLEGKKMSSSKGLGVTAREMSELIPPYLLRFLMTRYKPKTAINFSPEGETIPRLFDDFDKMRESFFGRRKASDPDEPRIFELSSLEKPVDGFRMQFSQIAFLTQVPGADLMTEAEKAAGKKLSESEKDDLNHRAEYAKKWVQTFLPQEDRLQVIELTQAIDNASKLSKEQKTALAQLSEQLESITPEQIKQISEQNNLKPSQVFEAAYLVTIGKTSGPKLIPMLQALGTDFSKKRLKLLD